MEPLILDSQFEKSCIKLTTECKHVNICIVVSCCFQCIIIINIVIVKYCYIDTLLLFYYCFIMVVFPYERRGLPHHVTVVLIHSHAS